MLTLVLILLSLTRFTPLLQAQEKEDFWLVKNHLIDQCIKKALDPKILGQELQGEMNKCSQELLEDLISVTNQNVTKKNLAQLNQIYINQVHALNLDWILNEFKSFYPQKRPHAFLFEIEDRLLLLSTELAKELQQINKKRALIGAAVGGVVGFSVALFQIKNAPRGPLSYWNRGHTNKSIIAPYTTLGLGGFLVVLPESVSKKVYREEMQKNDAKIRAFLKGKDSSALPKTEIEGLK
jgi:hypothetical protein